MEPLSPETVHKDPPDRNLAMELVRVTEAAAMAAGRWVGRGDKNGADHVAVEAMRATISGVSMRGTVVIGEGEKDDAPMLYNGEEVGDGLGTPCDVAVDPIDGTTLTAKGMNNAIAVLAVAPRGTMYDPSAVFYMEKLVAGPEAAEVVDIRLPVAENIHQVAKAKGSAPEDVTVVLLDRPRHQQLVDDIRATGARIKFIVDGDVAGAIMASLPDTGIDLLLGVGGTPEGIIAACAMKCTGGVIQGRLWPRDDDERQKALDAGHYLDDDHILHHRRPGHRRRLLLRRHRHHRRRADEGGALPRGRRHHALAGDAVAQRHDPVDHQPPPALEATRLRRRRLRALTQAGARPRTTTERPSAATTTSATRGSKARPVCEAVTSTGTASGSMQALQSTMPSRLE